VPGQEYNDWKDVASHLPGRGRSGKQVRDRWNNHLNPVLIFDKFSKEDDVKLWNAVTSVGKKWVEISGSTFQGTRSENQCKNRWNSVEFKVWAAREYGEIDTTSGTLGSTLGLSSFNTFGGGGPTAGGVTPGTLSQGRQTGGTSAGLPSLPLPPVPDTTPRRRRPRHRSLQQRTVLPQLVNDIPGVERHTMDLPTMKKQHCQVIFIKNDDELIVGAVNNTNPTAHVQILQVGEFCICSDSVHAHITYF